MIDNNRSEHLATRMPLARTLMVENNMSPDTILFDIQIAADLVDQRTAEGTLELAPEKLGPVRLPYPAMLMEWRESVLSADRISGFPDAMAFWLEERENGDGFWMMPMILNSGGHSCVIGLALGVITNEEGIIQHIQPQRSGKVYDLGGKTAIDMLDTDFVNSDKEFQDLAIATLTYGQTVLMALSLLNCRNVKTEALGKITARRSGTQKRRGVKPFEVRYNTIKLPGGGSERVGRGSKAHDRATALHRVRGHTKTFTAEAPLMGKHVGTYWWGWQLRGNPEHGIVESDYQMSGKSE